MKKSGKITLITTGSLAAVAAVAAPVAIALTMSAPRANSQGFFTSEGSQGAIFSSTDSILIQIHLQ